MRELGADYGIHGEGEGPLAELIGALERGRTEIDIPSVYTRDGPRREDTIVKEDLPKVSGDIADFHRNVVAVIRDGAEPEIKLFQVMRVMKLMEAIFQAAETKISLRRSL